KKSLLGVSREGREVWMVKIAHPERPARKNLLAVARIHPYETSGSYCAEGILDAFHRPSPITRDMLVRYNLYIVPMISPDGVFHGYGKLTTPGGIDLSKSLDMADASCVLLKALIDEVRPSVYVEFHNWMFKNVDGIYFMNYLQSRKFIRSMPSQDEFEKRWRPILRRKILSTPCFGFKKYCKENFHSVSVCLEYPWFGRSPEHVKTLGMHSIMALSKM
ncbi:MAG: M14 family zinc carboxypeptidase, partial [Chitinophagaceae bacterium]